MGHLERDDDVRHVSAASFRETNEALIASGRPVDDPEMQRALRAQADALHMKFLAPDAAPRVPMPARISEQLERVLGDPQYLIQPGLFSKAEAHVLQHLQNRCYAGFADSPLYAEYYGHLQAVVAAWDAAPAPEPEPEPDRAAVRDDHQRARSASVLAVAASRGTPSPPCGSAVPSVAVADGTVRAARSMSMSAVAPSTTTVSPEMLQQVGIGRWDVRRLDPLHRAPALTVHPRRQLCSKQNWCRTLATQNRTTPTQSACRTRPRVTEPCSGSAPVASQSFTTSTTASRPCFQRPCSPRASRCPKRSCSATDLSVPRTAAGCGCGGSPPTQADFVEKRGRALMAWLLSVTSHDFLSSDAAIEVEVRKFLMHGAYAKEKSLRKALVKTGKSAVQAGKVAVTKVGTASKAGLDGAGRLRAATQKLAFDAGRKGARRLLSHDAAAADNEADAIPVRALVKIFDAVFQLKGHTVLRKAVKGVALGIMKNLLGDNLNRKVAEAVDELTGVHSIAEYARCFREALWADGEPVPAMPDRSVDSCTRTAAEARAKCFGVLPSELKRLIGSTAAKQGVSSLIDMLQCESRPRTPCGREAAHSARRYPSLNRRLVYGLLEAFLVATFPDNTLGGVFAEMRRAKSSRAS